MLRIILGNYCILNLTVLRTKLVTHRVEPEFNNGGIIKLVDLAAHRDQPIPILNLRPLLLPRRLGTHFPQHGLSGNRKYRQGQEINRPQTTHPQQTCLIL